MHPLIKFIREESDKYAKGLHLDPKYILDMMEYVKNKKNNPDFDGEEPQEPPFDWMEVQFNGCDIINAWQEGFRQAERYYKVSRNFMNEEFGK